MNGNSFLICVNDNIVSDYFYILNIFLITFFMFLADSIVKGHLHFCRQVILTRSNVKFRPTFVMIVRFLYLPSAVYATTFCFVLIWYANGSL